MRPSTLPNGSQTLRHVDLIRWGAHSVASCAFTGATMVEACLWVELAGMPSDYRLSLTAQQYAIFQNVDQVAVRLAAQVGNPRIPPVPPHWPVLALLLLAWHDTISPDRILMRAAELGSEEEAQRGLAIVAYLFPELRPWLASAPLHIPRWERTLAVPLAARKLLLFERTN